PDYDAGGEPAVVEGDEPAEDRVDEPEAGVSRSAPEDVGQHVPPPTQEEITIDRLIDRDLLRLSPEELSETSRGTARSAETPPHVETIIMEGASVRTSLEADDAAAAEDPGRGGGDAADEGIDLRDTYVRTRDSARPVRRKTDGAARYAAMGGVAALALLLVAQVMHTWRGTLATYGAFGQTLLSVYEFAGAPITPEWDVNAWQFGGTRGRTDVADRVLTISSTIANASQRALPYPLLYVALTDRYEEIIASQLLEAGEYLEIRSADGLVAPGSRLQASVTIAPLSPQAEGFKLNVCYPLTGNQVRCATGAFKNP
ncbi:MAG TPA: DUF3426 domain-containing protein, partial [Woeseiaceae bacterium]|nr:DUF3426 domain-containing protein [Woeseiaceae bacterium]